MKKLKENKLISAIIFIPLLILSIFIILHIFDKQTDVPNVYTDVQEWGKYAGININIKTEEADNYSTSISTPITSSDYVNDFIEQWLVAEEDRFLVDLNRLSNRLTDDMMAHFNIQLEIDQLTADIYNLIFTTFTYLGESSGEHTTKVFTLDLANDHIFELTEIINLDDEKVFNKFQKIVNKVIKNDEQIVESIDVSSFERSLNEYEQLEWSIHEDQLTLHLHATEVSSDTKDTVELDIPLEKLTTVVDKQIVQDFDLTVIDEKIEEERKQAQLEKERKQKEKEKEAEKEDQSSIDTDADEAVDDDGKYVALTFDDGPSGTVTPEILHILNEFDAVATFFMLGIQVDYYPELAAEVASQGHEIANHTQNHMNLTTVRNDVARQEIALSREKIEEATGETPHLVRPPYGAYDNATINLASENDETLILWSVDPDDWKHRNPRTIERNVLQAVRPGSIILLHDIYESTAEALPNILEELKKQGYTFVTVSQLMEQEDMAAMKVIRGQ